MPGDCCHHEDSCSKFWVAMGRSSLDCHGQVQLGSPLPWAGPAWIAIARSSLDCHGQVQFGLPCVLFLATTGLVWAGLDWSSACKPPGVVPRHSTAAIWLRELARASTHCGHCHCHMSMLHCLGATMHCTAIHNMLPFRVIPSHHPALPLSRVLTVKSLGTSQCHYQGSWLSGSSGLLEAILAHGPDKPVGPDGL